MSKSVRTIGWAVHRWIGIGLAVLLLPIAVSGSLLVWHAYTMWWRGRCRRRFAATSTGRAGDLQAAQ